MKFGCCTGVDNIPVLEKAGYDYVELAVVGLKPEGPEAEFKKLKEKILANKLKPEVFNGFLPGDLKIVGKDANFPRAAHYVDVALLRVKELGGEIVIFGSGTSRKIPDDFPTKKASIQMEEFLQMVADAAKKYGVIIGIEPLNKDETNSINTVKDAVNTCKMIGRPEIMAQADFWHMFKENEPFSNLVDAKSYLVHIHVADTDRKQPGSGSFDYPGFFKHLKTAGYDKRVSVECGWSNFVQECGPSLKFLKDNWAKA